jgi:hypothetical protein
MTMDTKRIPAVRDKVVVKGRIGIFHVTRVHPHEDDVDLRLVGTDDEVFRIPSTSLTFLYKL